MKTIKRITEYVGEEHKKGGNIRSNIENEQKYNIKIPTAPYITKTINANGVVTILSIMEVDMYVKRKYMTE